MSLRSLRALCLTSFFIADVRDGLGPFLGIFLTQRHWQAEDIGLLMTVGGVAGLLATLPPASSPTPRGISACCWPGSAWRSP